ncbi:MAG: aryl-sulfate sulfotransferase [Thermodesulfobacteriota bacterium]|nr:aryl-sulfate sulfotransferase [Thermodesulfobacteriota bacterium]
MTGKKPALLFFSVFLYCIVWIGGDGCEILRASEVDKGEIYVDIYDSKKTFNGNTLFADSHDPENQKVIEVDMEGQIVWEFLIPQSWIQGQTVGLDAKLLDNGNILMVISGSGLYEIDRYGNIVWYYQDPKVSHDADRLTNGNTIYVYGNNDTKDDAQVKEVNSQGNLIWSWYAKNYYDYEPYASRDRGGWAHTNSVTRLDGGNTLINLRNFDLTIEVDSQGTVVWSFDWLKLYDTTDPRGFDPHEPEIQPNGNLLVCLQWDTPYQIVEIDRVSGQPVWEYRHDGLRTCRDSDRLPNGNTLIVGVLTGGTDSDYSDDESVIFEVTSAGEIVWQLKLKDSPTGQTPGWFYRAQRIYQGDAVVWESAYRTLFSSMADLELLRLYRDVILNKTAKGKLYTTLLYKNSKEALEVLFNNPELMLQAKHIIDLSMDGVSDILIGNECVVHNTDEIVSFMDLFAGKSPPALKNLANMIKEEMVTRRKQGKLFMGFRLE